MSQENMLDGFEGEVNINSAVELIERLEMLPVSELSLHAEDINEMIGSLRLEQENGIDTPGVRSAIAKLNLLREKSQQN